MTRIDRGAERGWWCVAIGERISISGDDGGHLLTTQCVSAAMQGRYYPHFRDEETEVQEGQVNHPNSQWQNQHGTQICMTLDPRFFPQWSHREIGVWNWGPQWQDLLAWRKDKEGFHDGAYLPTPICINTYPQAHSFNWLERTGFGVKRWASSPPIIEWIPSLSLHPIIYKHHHISPRKCITHVSPW